MFFILNLIIVVLVPLVANANDETLIDQIRKTVKDICLAPSDNGKYWEVDVSGKGDATVKLKMINPGLSGAAHFKKVEWEGVQKVLQEKQAAEHANYRECAAKLTPLFLDKFSAKSPSIQKKSLNNKKSKAREQLQKKNGN